MHADLRGAALFDQGAHRGREPCHVLTRCEPARTSDTDVDVDAAAAPQIRGEFVSKYGKLLEQDAMMNRNDCVNNKVRGSRG